MGIGLLLVVRKNPLGSIVRLYKWRQIFRKVENPTKIAS